MKTRKAERQTIKNINSCLHRKAPIPISEKLSYVTLAMCYYLF